MLMSNETIAYLYREAIENGDPSDQIKSLAKANNVNASVIKDILQNAGEELPKEIKPGSPSKKKVEEIIKAAGIKDDQEDRKEDSKEETPVQKELAPVKLPMPDTVRDVLMKSLDDIDREIAKRQEEIKRLEAKYITISEYIKKES